MKNPKLFTIGLAAATTLLFAGCQQAEQTSHDQDAHDESAHAEHAEHAEATPSVEVVENPTAEQIAAAKPYPLDHCLISDEKLGEMGKPVVVLVGNQQIKLCCKDCLPDVKKDPAKVLAKLSEGQKTTDETN